MILDLPFAGRSTYGTEVSMNVINAFHRKLQAIARVAAAPPWHLTYIYIYIYLREREIECDTIVSKVGACAIELQDA